MSGPVKSLAEHRAMLSLGNFLLYAEKHPDECIKLIDQITQGAGSGFSDRECIVFALGAIRGMLRFTGIMPVRTAAFLREFAGSPNANINLCPADYFGHLRRRGKR